jgi:hypothetical protein
MKRFVLVFILLAIAGTFLGADTSEYYPVRVDVVKILSHAEGFRVIYRKGLNGVADVLIPSGWFVPGGKAELIKAVDPSYPYMVVFYKGEGKFDHLRLYAQKNQADSSWGIMTQEEGRGKFSGIEEIKLQF